MDLNNLSRHTVFYRCALVWVLWICLLSSIAMAADDANALPWIHGPARVQLGGIASFDLPAGFYCLNTSSDIQKFYSLIQDVDPNSLAVIVDERFTMKLGFSYQETGHISDDEKNQLNAENADAILQSITQGTAAANIERKQRQYGTISVMGWKQVPAYDEGLHALTWAVLAVDDTNHQSMVNYSVCLLGRTGVLVGTMAGESSTVDQMVPACKTITQTAQFNADQDYSSFRPGDKTATYGLTALVTGGTAVVLAKNSAWLGKLGAAITAMLVAAAAKMKSWFKRGKPVPATVGAATANSVTCPACGQANRLRPEATTIPTCGRCGAKLA